MENILECNRFLIIIIYYIIYHINMLKTKMNVIKNYDQYDQDRNKSLCEIVYFIINM